MDRRERERPRRARRGEANPHEASSEYEGRKALGKIPAHIGKGALLREPLQNLRLLAALSGVRDL